MAPRPSPHPTYANVRRPYLTMSDPKPLATFHAYTEDEVKLHADAAEVSKGAHVFDAYLRKLVIHESPKMNGKPMYDLDTVERIRDAYHNFVGEYL